MLSESDMPKYGSAQLVVDWAKKPLGEAVCMANTTATATKSQKKIQKRSRDVMDVPREARSMMLGRIITKLAETSNAAVHITRHRHS